MDTLNNSDSEEELSPETHKKSLDKLKKIDPDFYSFLEQNDENLLNFEANSENDDDKGSDDEGDDDDQIHIPGPLQGDSDESDFEDERSTKVTGKVTLKLVAQLQTELQTEGKVKLSSLVNAIKVFNAAMLRVTSEDGESAPETEYKVEGSSVFNAVIQMCVLYLPAAIKKYLGMEQSGKDPQKCKHFVKIKSPLISYLKDLLKLLSGVTSTNILTVLLKHLHQMCTYIACFSRIAKLSLKKLITLWSNGEETVRVLAFLCILRITRNQQATLLDVVIKTMYLTYVKNTKFVSPTTWPGINFMRRSLVEIFTLDLNVSYRHVFLYIRQLAIHLRNAIVVQKVENRQAVYNWQFINSLHLWAELLGVTSNKPALQPLVYPLVMIITNTIKLVPTPQYYPLRFHCVEILIKLSKESNTFIPILPYLVELQTVEVEANTSVLQPITPSSSNIFIDDEPPRKRRRFAKENVNPKILTNFNFNKKHKKVSMKPVDFSCVLRLAKSQLAENGFKDTVIEKLYALLLEYTAHESYRIAFPDLIVLAIVQMKQFLKNCTVGNYTKKMRQLLEKIEENAKFIERERAKICFSLTDEKLISAWEANIKNKGTPLYKFYENWNKINRIQKRKKITKNDDTSTILPTLIKRPKLSAEVESKLEKGPLVLFPSDSEDGENIGLGEDEEESKPKVKKLKKKKELKKKLSKLSDTNEEQIKDVPDVVQEFSVSDL